MTVIPTVVVKTARGIDCRVARHDEEDAIQPECGPGIRGGDDVPHVDRIERPPEHTDAL